MDFNFYISATSPQDIALRRDDTLDYLRESIALCGHTSRISIFQLQRECINIVFEPIENPDELDWILNARANGMRFGLVVSELYINDELPYLELGFAVMSANDASRHERFRKRLPHLKKLVGSAEFCWALLERSSQNFERTNPNSFFYPFGYTKTIPKELRGGLKDIDVLFVGKATPHRLEVLQSLANAGISVMAFGPDFQNGFLPEMMIASVLDRTKIGLSITLNGARQTSDGLDERFASCTRIQQMLTREMCVVSEDIPWDNPYSPFMVSAPLNSLAVTCRELLDSGAWEKVGIQNATKFREQMNAKVVCKPVLEKSISIFLQNPTNKAD